ncbi:MAG: Ig-like domain-containing protein, partial [archaeon]|nr:Ig-like domain-containing protein [archaeon]
NYIKYTYLTNEYQYTVNYVDADGNVIADAYVGTAPYAAPVVPEVPEIVGYTAPAEQTIIISDDESKNVVDYVYTVNKYGYTVNYLNKDEAKIAKSLTGTAAFGTTVVGKVLDIAGYITPEPISIVIDADESVNVIDYVYLPAPAPVAVTGVTLDKTSVYFGIGETVTLVATVAPADAANKNVIWSSSSKAVVTVADGVLTAVSVGKATVTVTTVDGGFTATCEVTVTDVPVVHVNGIYLSKSTVTLDKGTTTVLSAMVLPDNATDKTVVWSSSKDSVATVVDGVVTAVAKGTATITVTTVDGGFTATCAVTVNDDTEEGPMWGVVVIFAVVCAGIIGYLVVLARRAKE